MKKFLLVAIVGLCSLFANAQTISYCSGSGGGAVVSASLVRGPGANQQTLTIDLASEGNRLIYVVIRQGGATGPIIYESGACVSIKGGDIYTLTLNTTVPISNQYVSIGVAAGNQCNNAIARGRGTIPCGESGVLPVQLSAFNARKNASKNDLHWSTSMERNVKEFVVQVSSNGRDFKDLGKVAATNNPTGSNYSFSDASLAGGDRFYRLKIVDLDGYTEFSTVRKIGAKAVSFVLSPNPSRGAVTIYLNNSTDLYDIIFLNAAGKEVRRLKSISTVETTVNNLKNGVYFVRMVNHQTGETSTEKLLVTQ